MTRKFAKILVAGTLLAFTLSGCLPGGVTPTPSPTDSTSPTPTAGSATPDPEPTEPALSEIYLSPEGLGPLVMSEAPPVTDPALDILLFDPDFCPGYGVPDGWKWVANYPETPDGFGGTYRPFAVDVVGGVIERIQVNSPDLRTESGIHINSTLDELLAAYPGGFTSTTNHADITKVYSLVGVHGQILFEVAIANEIGYWTPADIDHVLFIEVTTRDTEPYGVAATDAGIGGCERA
jgi:hypothetical protein